MIEDASTINEFAFLSKFRWRLEGKNFNPDWAQNLRINFVDKLLAIDLYQIIREDDEDVMSLQWAETIPDNSLSLTTYDADGESIYRYVFENIKLTKRSEVFDYGTTSTASHRIELKCGKISRDNHLTKRRINRLVNA